ncbi:NUMOD4 domain-containing protein [Cytobacillus firmus]|uniref:NUMOD4 domain-containing protein n=1 Tax=Cytobacillus firmus TaxID=1399 RepID=UPI0036CCD5EA
MLYLYDPRTNILAETTFDYVLNIAGVTKSSLRSMMSKRSKLAKINCYLVDEKITLAERKDWYIKEKYHQEVWKEIEGSDGKFLISSYGRVQRVYKKHNSYILPFLHRKHLMVKVWFKGKYQQVKTGHLVANHFLNKPKPGEVLHHKNGIVTDDFVGNLEYISKKELGRKTAHKAKARPVVKIDPVTFDVIDEYRSSREAGRQNYRSYQSVLDNCNKRTKSSAGMHFMWADEYEEIYETEELCHEIS